MKEKEMTCMREEWEHLSTQQLDELLQAELRKESPLQEVVLPILDILHNRENPSVAAISEETTAAWERYKERISTPVKHSHHRHRWLLSATAVAAAVCLVVMAVPRTAGAESILDMLYRWTSSIFQFVDPNNDETKPQATDEFVTDNAGLQQLHDELAALGVTENVVPMWLPAGSTLSELKVTPMPDGNKVRALLDVDNFTITFSYRVYTAETPMQYEKGDMPVEIHDIYGKEHFIMDNDGRLLIAWKGEDVECTIGTDLEKETVYEIIKSIYRSGLFEENPTHGLPDSGDEPAYGDARKGTNQ